MVADKGWGTEGADCGCTCGEVSERGEVGGGSGSSSGRGVGLGAGNESS